MYLSKLKLNNFKNIVETDLTFCKNVNCFVGENGVGKTNLLDSIHYLSFCKSATNPIAMAKAFKIAVEAGRMAFGAGLPCSSIKAQATSPLTAFLD